MKEQNDELRQLKNLLAGLDKKDIYRSVYDMDGKLLAEGLEPLRQYLIDDFKSVDFSGRTVADLGCNFGFFSFLAADSGASHVTGVDFMPEIVEGGRLLALLGKYGNVSFTTFNFEQPDKDLGRFDMVMLVDFFGRSNIRKRKVEYIINFMKSVADKEMLFAIRPLNRIVKDLRMSESEFSSLYPGQYISAGVFNLLHYIKDLLDEEWEIRPVSQYDGEFRKHKILFICSKR